MSNQHDIQAGQEAVATKHTPGPWRARIVPGHQDEIIVEASDVEANVARVNGFPKTKSYAGSGTDDPKANARIIAAAPDLLAALKSVEWTGQSDDGEGSL